MTEVWRVIDRLGREVTLTEARQAHILAKRPELASRLEEIRATVDSPHEVRRDAKYAPRENHYRRTGPGRLMLKVVVHYRPVPPQGTWAGEVITSHPVGRIDPKEAPLWP